MGRPMKPIKFTTSALEKFKQLISLFLPKNFEEFIATNTDVVSRLRRSALSDPGIMTVGPITESYHLIYYTKS